MTLLALMSGWHHPLITEEQQWVNTRPHAGGRRQRSFAPRQTDDRGHCTWSCLSQNWHKVKGHKWKFRGLHKANSIWNGMCDVKAIHRYLITVYQTDLKPRHQGALTQTKQLVNKQSLLQNGCSVHTVYGLYFNNAKVSLGFHMITTITRLNKKRKIDT